MLNQFNNLKNKVSSFVENKVQQAKNTAKITIEKAENFVDNKLSPSQCNPQDIAKTVAAMKDQLSKKNKPN